jgi:predicted Abi (CAAX) family protease
MITNRIVWSPKDIQIVYSNKETIKQQKIEKLAMLLLRLQHKLKEEGYVKKDWATINGNHVYFGDDGKAYSGKEGYARAQSEKAANNANYKDLKTEADILKYEEQNKTTSS